MNRSIRGSDSRTASSQMILEVQKTTYLKWEMIQQSEQGEPGYRLLDKNLINRQMITNFKFKHIVTLGMRWGQFWNEIGPQQPGPCATACVGQVG